MWLFGHLFNMSYVIWSSGNRVIWSSCHLVFWSPGRFQYWAATLFDCSIGFSPSSFFRGPNTHTQKIQIKPQSLYWRLFNLKTIFMCSETSSVCIICMCEYIKILPARHLKHFLANIDVFSPLSKYEMSFCTSQQSLFCSAERERWMKEVCSELQKALFSDTSFLLLIYTWRR